MPSETDLHTTTLRLLGERAPEASICPSEVARAVGGTAWRTLMPAVNEAAAELADAGELIVTQGTAVVDIRRARGPVRLRVGRTDQQGQERNT